MISAVSVVDQAQAPGQCELVSVTTELYNISQRIGSVATLSRIQDQDAIMAKVAEELQKTSSFTLPATESRIRRNRSSPGLLWAMGC